MGQKTLTNYLVVSKPYPIICNGECEDMVHKRLTLGVVVWSRKRLTEKKHYLLQKQKFVCSCLTSVLCI